MKKNFYGNAFRFFQLILRVFTKKHKVPSDLKENEGAVVYISHHQNFYGPFMMMAWFPHPVHIWALHVFCNQKDCFNQIANVTFIGNLKWPKWAAYVVSYPLSYVIAGFVRSSKAIPVYRESRKIINTFKESVHVLQKEESILIFPDTEYNNKTMYTNEIYEGFLGIEKFYYKATGKHVTFVPVLVHKEERKIRLGEAIQFRDDATYTEEKKRVASYIHKSLNHLVENAK